MASTDKKSSRRRFFGRIKTMEEQFTIQNAVGQKIVGVINWPEGDGPFPTTIIAHGFKGFKEELLELGFLVFRFDFTNGIGESDGDISDITIGHYVSDLRAIFEYALSNKLVEKDNIIVYATSLGGTVALLFAAQHPKIRRLVLHEPVVKPSRLPAPDIDLKKWKEQGYWIFHSSSKNKDYKVGYKFYEERKNYDIFEVAREVAVPTLILHNPKTEELPYTDSEEIVKELPVGSKVHPLSDVPHAPKTKEQIIQIKEAIISFIRALSSRF